MVVKSEEVREAIQQAKAFRNRGQEPVLSIWLTADVVRRRFAEIIEPAGLSVEQYNVLRILRGAGEDGLPTTSIPGRMLVRFPAITRLIDKLESKGLVRRSRSQKDRRKIRCFITAKGLDLLSPLDALVDRNDEECVDMLDDDEVKQLNDLLGRVRSGAGKKLLRTVA